MVSGPVGPLGLAPVVYLLLDPADPWGYILVFLLGLAEGAALAVEQRGADRCRLSKPCGCVKVRRLSSLNLILRAKPDPPPESARSGVSTVEGGSPSGAR